MKASVQQLLWMEILPLLGVLVVEEEAVVQEEEAAVQLVQPTFTCGPVPLGHGGLNGCIARIFSGGKTF